MDILLASTWKRDALGRLGRGGGTSIMADTMQSVVPQYVWKGGKDEVVVERDGESWHVVHSTVPRLFGPRNVSYDARHREMRHIAWDVMACVIRSTGSEEEGVAAGREVARWMVERPILNA